jgi:dihydroorotase
MKLLIRQARIVDARSPHNGQILDIFIEKGIIKQAGNNLDVTVDEEINLSGLHVSPGWMDVFADFGDPGYEYKESLQSGANAAAAGGYTDVMILPNTNPVLHNKSNIEYVIQKANSLPVTIHPIGAITKNTEGKELAEMYDMQSGGAIAFSDGINSVQSAGVLVKALQYIKSFDGTIIQLPDDKSVNPHGLMNEGITSTRLGLSGKPVIGEELIIERDLKLAGYAGSRIHFTGVSSEMSLEYIRKAKDRGINVTCSVTPYHLFFCDEDLLSYDTNLKVNPPLRTAADREALRKGISDGTIDCIASHHLPHEYDSKTVEFEYAKYGMISLETAFAALRTCLPEITLEKWIELLSINPARVFGRERQGINADTQACLSLFDPGQNWKVTTDQLYSKSKNSPFLGKELTGKVIGIINKDQVFLNK